MVPEEKSSHFLLQGRSQERPFIFLASLKEQMETPKRLGTFWPYRTIIPEEKS